jgi:hypothetical protein
MSEKALPDFVSVGHVPYWRGQVWPRRQQAFLNRRVAGAAVAAVGLPLLLHLATPLSLISLTIDSLASAGLGYAALSFGACIMGAVLVLTLPSTRQIGEWATTAMKGNTHSRLSDLLFVFTFSAMLQLAVVVTCGVAFVVGGDGDAWPENPKTTHVLLFGLSTFIVIFSVQQLVAVVRTISTVGHAIIVGLNTPAKR